MKKTAIILAGGASGRLGRDKGLVKIGGKPLVLHVFDRVRGTVEESLVVVGSESQRASYSPLFPEEVRILVDRRDSQNPLIGALTGFSNACGDYSVLLPCDTPFISKKVISLLFEVVQGMDAVIPRWPNGYIEPLQAVYRTDSSLTVVNTALMKGETRFRTMVSLLKRVRYLSTTIIKDIDRDLTTFLNINNIVDFEVAKAVFKKKQSRETGDFLELDKEGLLLRSDEVY